MPHALIVDDDTDTRDFLSEVARAEGFSVAAADTLRSARAQLAGRHPDVLLADLQLPDGNGMELIGDLDRAIETEVIVVTGHASVGTTSGYLTTERDARLAAMKGFGDRSRPK